ncbi:MAG: 30S ribosomal protein S17 [Mariprofundaceae bacterium]
MTESKGSNKRILEGVVLTNGGDKSIVVEVERKFMHSRYHKIVRSHKKYLAHDEENSCNVGDRVRIHEARPMSKRKCWMLAEIITHAEQL